MSRASVPVVGYLSFRASSSAIPNDFIDLADHLNPNPKLNSTNQLQTLQKIKKIQSELTSRFYRRALYRVSCIEEDLKRVRKESKWGLKKTGFFWLGLRCGEHKEDGCGLPLMGLDLFWG